MANEVAALFGASSRPVHQAFFQTLHTAGYTVGNHVVPKYADGDFCTGQLDTLAQQLVALDPCVIVVGDTPSALAAAQARANANKGQVPIVAAVIDNPTLVALKAASGNIHVLQTPVKPELNKMTAITADFVLKAGKPPDVRLIYNQSNPGAQGEVLKTKAWFAAQPVVGRVNVQEVAVSCVGANSVVVNYSANAVAALAPLAGVGAIMVIGDPASAFYRGDVLAFAQLHGIATTWESFPAMTSGGTICWGPSRTDAWAKAANIVFGILAIRCPLPAAGAASTAAPAALAAAATSSDPVAVDKAIAEQIGPSAPVEFELTVNTESLALLDIPASRLGDELDGERIHWWSTGTGPQG